jgi:hypothetical protein
MITCPIVRAKSYSRLDATVSGWETADTVRLALERPKLEESFLARRKYVMMKRAHELDMFTGEWIAVGKDGLLAHGDTVLALLTKLRVRFNASFSYSDVAPSRQWGLHRPLYYPSR